MSNELTVTVPEGLPYVDFEREFDAPVAAVFRAHQDPSLITQWFGPEGYENEIEEWNFVTGGRWRIIQRKDGEEFAFNGVYHVVRENEFAIQTFEFEGWPDVVSVETLTLEDLGNGRTRMRGHSTYPSLEARDGMVDSGMEGGMAEGFDRLDKVLANL